MELWGTKPGIPYKKRRKKEDIETKITSFDSRKEKYNRETENKNTEEQDLHERVRKIWENGGYTPEEGEKQTNGKRKNDSGRKISYKTKSEKYLSGRETGKVEEMGKEDYPDFYESKRQGEIRTAGMGAHSKFLPDPVKKNGDKLAETENSYSFSGSERKYEVFSEYESIGESFSNTESKEVQIAEKTEIKEKKDEISDFDVQAAAMAEHIYNNDKNSPLGSRLTDGWWLIDSYEGNIKSYIVKNEILHGIQRKVNDNVDVSYLQDQNVYGFLARFFPNTHTCADYVKWLLIIMGGAENHSMSSVIGAMQKEREQK